MSTRLSVIVPIYDVEQYLPACLDSLAGQSMKDLEVVMVDDGSPDGSAAIAAAYAARDGRFRLVRKENAGLGAARNTGLANVSPSSEYVAFVDSDDVVPPDAYRTMVGSLDESGSDFATGNVHHLRGRRSGSRRRCRCCPATSAAASTSATTRGSSATGSPATRSTGAPSGTSTASPFRRECCTRTLRSCCPPITGPRPSTSSAIPSTTGGCARAEPRSRSPSAAPNRKASATASPASSPSAPSSRRCPTPGPRSSSASTTTGSCATTSASSCASCRTATTRTARPS